MGRVRLLSGQGAFMDGGGWDMLGEKRWVGWARSEGTDG